MWAVLLLVVLDTGHLGPGPDSLPRATVIVDSGAHQLVIQLPPVDVPAAGRGGEVMVGLPLCQVLVPLDVTLHGSWVDIADGSGRLLPHEMLHHFNLSDPDRRELFLPIGLHLLAMSRETPAITVPRLLFGLPLARGQRLIAGAMLRPFFEAYEIVSDVLRDAPAEIDEKDLTKKALGVGRQYAAQDRVRSNEAVSALLFATARQVAADQHLLEPAADLDERRTAFRDELRGILGDMDTVEQISREQFYAREVARRIVRGQSA